MPVLRYLLDRSISHDYKNAMASRSRELTAPFLVRPKGPAAGLSLTHSRSRLRSFR